MLNTSDERQPGGVKSEEGDKQNEWLSCYLPWLCLLRLSVCIGLGYQVPSRLRLLVDYRAPSRLLDYGYWLL